MTVLKLHIDGTKFRDPQNREVTLRGINVAADAKFPKKPDLPSHIPTNFFDADDVSFVGRPFTEDQSHEHFARLKRWGYNTIRYIFTWEAIEHLGPGKYDEQWITHTIEVLRVAKSYGFFVFMDPHQDVWSRLSGGSGAPTWTLYAAGLNPRGFLATQAAWVHNTYEDPANYPKMIWSTNYTRLACQVMFTLFFGGKAFAPKAIVDGMNIQDYLQDHYIAACRHLAQRIHEAGDLENECIIGWESFNEPNRGLISWQDVSVIPSEQKMQKGPSPTAWQAILLGSGRPCEMDDWDFGGLGPYKTGTKLIDPKGEMAWLPADYDDTAYGWKRDPGWKLGQCVWAQHGVWDPSTDELLKKDYFGKDPQTGMTLNYEVFTNEYFMPHYRKYRDAIRSVHKDAIMFCQPPVLEIPPSIKGTADDDPNMVFVPHYYDGITLVMKKWNKLWNVDVFGILRGKYLTPAFAIKIGETAIRNCLRDQLNAIREEGMDYMGSRPCVFTEIGIPFDMNDKKAYSDGDYSSQSSAMDANHFALEGSGANGFTLWTYMATNNHEWGDLWNGEDLSIYSLDDRILPTSTVKFGLNPGSNSASALSLDQTSPAFSQSRSSTSNSPLFPSNLNSALKTPSIDSRAAPGDLNCAGFRAAEAFIRPSPIRTHGDVSSYGFDLRNAIFTFSLSAPSATPEDKPTEIYLPEFHFPQTQTQVEVTGGKWAIENEEVGGDTMQRLKWWHAEGEQNVTVKGVKHKLGTIVVSDEDVGYLEQCQKNICLVM